MFETGLVFTTREFSKYFYCVWAHAGMLSIQQKQKRHITNIDKQLVDQLPVKICRYSMRETNTKDNHAAMTTVIKDHCQ